ncbi:MAG TPA: L-aspartate oxidase, partial [Acidimicrobiia bacterium]|nr:L-aspartate oxidase [Acidimicrobiia bacterium]
MSPKDDQRPSPLLPSLLGGTPASRPLTPFDVLVLGSGVAGLSAALQAVRSGRSVVLLTKGALAQSTTRFAQGGVAAALAEPDSPSLHETDTINAGAGLCDLDAVHVLVTEGPDRVRELIEFGAAFDRTGDVDSAPLALAREGGHSLARVVHAGGDATGAEIERALVAAVRATAIDVREGWFTVDLIVNDGCCVGVRALDPQGDLIDVRAPHTILATGGAGQVFAVTTNPELSTGDGIAMALRAGVVVADVEFMQFHPTALDHPSMPRPLLSEALRGEGAVLRDEEGVAFMTDEHPLGDLAPRDVVARAITRRLIDRGLTHLWLDATTIPDFPGRFPTIWRACQAVGLDPTRQWLPVAPAAHYLSGGVATDLDGATTLPGLWAVGEVACSGVHGANRLASNSLLDGLVFGPRAVDAILRDKRTPNETGVLRGVLPVPPPHTAPVSRGDHEDDGRVDKLRMTLQLEMTRHAGVMRTADSLREATDAIAAVEVEASMLARDSSRAWELRNLCAVARALVASAAAREESRGTHWRSDYPFTSGEYLGR